MELPRNPFLARREHDGGVHSCDSSAARIARRDRCSAKRDLRLLVDSMGTLAAKLRRDDPAESGLSRRAAVLCVRLGRRALRALCEELNGHEVQLACMRHAMREDLFTRELDRMRVIERAHVVGGASDARSALAPRVAQSVARVEAALAALCPEAAVGCAPVVVPAARGVGRERRKRARPSGAGGATTARARSVRVDGDALLHMACSGDRR
jgi:hypothetical protein